MLLNEEVYMENEALASKGREWLRAYSDDVILAQRRGNFPNPEDLFE